MRSQPQPDDPRNTHQITPGIKFSSLHRELQDFKNLIHLLTKKLLHSAKFQVFDFLLGLKQTNTQKYAVPVLIQSVGLLKETDTVDH